jgi:hypothetical protein
MYLYLHLTSIINTYVFIVDTYVFIFVIKKIKIWAIDKKKFVMYNYIEG